jgi:putative endonuclease
MRARRPDPVTPVPPVPPDLSKRARGRWGEARAAAHYQRLGYTVLDRNWRSPNGELDLVVERDGIVVFSEVKARRDDRYGPAAAAVGPAKRRRIRLLAAEWLDTHRHPRSGIRFDVVAITGVRLDVIESAF